MKPKVTPKRKKPTNARGPKFLDRIIVKKG